MEHRRKCGRTKTTYMGNINDWIGGSTAESFHMALNRGSWRGKTWQAVQAANAQTVKRQSQTAPKRLGPDRQRWVPDVEGDTSFRTNSTVIQRACVQKNESLKNVRIAAGRASGISRTNRRPGGHRREPRLNLYQSNWWQSRGSDTSHFQRSDPFHCHTYNQRK
ncbi:hypothetical protein RRG08_033408 [Elysia crispata]|uniref:Uncharacterized protein n=1 Tax=Elysia crispata TaxID=231223 RepID=A0AAE0XYY4_9GAST|nr:hypothetical protein RRG08_033408 [Elysia crispata]